MKTYHGTRTLGGDALVWVSDDNPDASRRNYDLPLRLDLVNHSPTGFEWGYRGSGPAQLALAILADHFDCRVKGDTASEDVLAWYQWFKDEAISGLQRQHWSMTSLDVVFTIDRIREQRHLALHESGDHP